MAVAHTQTFLVSKRVEAGSLWLGAVVVTNRQQLLIAAHWRGAEFIFS